LILFWFLGAGLNESRT